MFLWQIAFALEMLVILVGFWVLLKAANVAAGPKLFAQIVAVIVIIISFLLAGCTLTKAILYALEDNVAAQPFYVYDAARAPAPPPNPAPRAASPATPKEPVPEWKGDLMKKKWDERGEMMKKKWAERGKK